MIKRILVALDPDIDTQVATKYAMRLAKKTDASLTGLAVVDSDEITAATGGGGIGTFYYADQLREFMTENSRKEAGRLLAKFEHTVQKSGVRHSEVMGEGVPYERIIEDMKYHDLLIIGRDTYFLYDRPDHQTDTLAKIIKKGNVPTLVAMESYRDVHRVLVAYDESFAAARALQWFIQLEPYGRDLEIDLVAVNVANSETGRDESNLVLRLAEDFLKVHGFTHINKTILPEKSTGKALIKHQNDISADLFVLGAHAISAIKRLTFGSTTHHLVTNSSVPLFMSH